MIFAPRSWPSRPGFAITTLILAATVGQYRNVKLTVVGCSPAWPNPGGAHSGYLVASDGGRLLLDCGPGVLARLRTSEDWPWLEAIVISHFHLDHCGDLVPWLWGHLLGPVKGRPGPELWLPPNGRGRLELLSRGAGWDRAFSIHEYAEAVAFDAAGLRVTPRRVPHYDEPTWGFRIEDGRSALAYSADTGPSPVLEELARDADVFLCEATLLEPETDPHGHMTADEARDAARAAGARRLLLTHRGAEHPLEELVYDGLEVEL
jgi:ribonuclease BN (tRNA processing enzyme)